jgi:membrane protease YdiL (CAAX protease family)
VLVGVGALVFVRLRLVVAPDPSRVAALAILYVGILGACLVTPSWRARGRPVIAAAVGLAAVAVTTVLLPRPVPLPFAPAALPLAVLAAVAEEALFRGVAFDAFRDRGDIVAVLVTALVFAAVHVPLYGVAAFPLDLGAGLMLGWQRSASGSWHVPAATHAVMNVLGVLR